MHAWNNNSKQRERLSKEQFAAVMKIARELETQQKDLYFEWKNWYHNEKLNRDHCVGQKEKKKNDEGVTTRPVVSCQHDVCEKLEQHFCAVDHDDMKEYRHSWCV